MSNEIRQKFLAFFAIAESIALLVAIIPFIIAIFQMQDCPTDKDQLIHFFDMIPWFLIGQIPGMIISAFINGLLGNKRFLFSYFF